MFVVLFLLALVTALVYLRFGRQQSKRIIDLPGPRGWPLVGNLFQLDSRRPDLTMVEWAKKWPVYVMYILNTPYVVASSYEAMNEVLVTKGRIFGGRGKPFRRMFLTFNGKDITAGDQTSPHWQPLRKSSQKVMRQSGENHTSVETLVLQMSEEFVSKVSLYNGQPADIRNDIYDFTTKIAFLMITGKKPADNNAICSLQRVIAFERATQTGFGTKGLELDVFPWLKHLGHPMYSKLIQARQLHLDMWDTLWADYQATKPAEGEDSDRTDLMHMAAQMLDPQSPAYQKDLDMDNMKGLFWNILIGSVASTTATLYSLVNILLHYPAVLKKLQDEIDRVVGSKCHAQVEDRERMPYMTATLFELLRYNSIAPSFPHAAIEDTTLQSVAIPAGTIVLPLYSALHREEQFWGDPWTFRPERLLAEDGSLLPPDHPTRRHMFPFGAGARVCAGEVFAMKRLFLFTSTLIQSFDLIPGDTMTSCHPNDYATGNVLHPPSFTVRLVKRVASATPGA